MTTFSSIAGRAMLVGIVVGLMQSSGKAVSAETGTVGIAAAAATPDSRLACPPDAKVDEAVKLIRAAYEEAYDTAKDTGEPDPLIEQLTTLADQATDPAKKYALLLEAEAIATQYENYSTALDLLEKRAQRFRIDGLKLRSQLLKRLAGPKVAADLVLFDQASDTAEKAMQAERFDVASEAAGLAVSVAKAIDREQKAEAKKRGRSAGTMGKDEAGTGPIGVGLVKKATALQSRVNAAQKLFAEYGKALSHIESEPDDASANSVVAKYLCFVRGEWEKGLPALAKSDLESLKSVAATEISLLADGKRDTKQVFDLAGAWWAASESKDLNADQESAVKDHAAGFYADVADSLSDLLEKQLAKSRLRGLNSKALNRGNQPTVFDFSRPNQLEKFTVGGVMRETSKGLEFPGRGSSWIDSRQSFAGPLEATFVASTFPDMNLDCYVGIFSSQPLMSFLESGIHLHWGCFGNTRTLLYVFGTIHEIRHKPIEAGREYTITLRVSKDRQLTVLIDELIIHQEVLPLHLKLEGSVRCGGGIGHVLYRSATVVTGQAAAGIKAAEPVGNALEQIVYLSDLPETDPVVGYGVFGKNGELGYEGLKIVVGGEPSPKGISVHPFSNGMSRVTYKVPEGCTHFEGRAAIADGRLPQQTAVIFRVLNEQEDVLWKSRPLKGKGAGEECSIALNGAKSVTLTVECPGSFNYAYAVWVEPRFIRKSVANGKITWATVDDVLGIKFVYVPSGSFRMGSPQNQEGRFAGENLVDVTITRPFLISQTEVTQSQWKRVMGSEPWKGKPFVKEGDNYPASYISWEMANEFCNRLTERERFAGRVPNERYTMPTEAQWEYACRAGTQTAYSFGDDKSLLGDYAWWGGHECGGNSRGQEYGHEVATKKPNPWGIYDMHGNMWEWCLDFAAGDQVGGVDPKGPPSGPGHIFRGGGWPECPTFLRSANRTDGGPAIGNFGVRVVRVAYEPPTVIAPQSLAKSLTTLTLEQARALAMQQGPLELKRVTTLSPEVARELAKHRAGMVLGLTTLSLEVAQAFEGHKGTLYLDRVDAISPEVAQALAKQPGHLALYGLTTLSPDVARELAKHKDLLMLNGMTALPEEVAQLLANTAGGLFLQGITTVTPEAARALAKHKAGLALGLTTLSLEVAQAFEGHEGTLYLDRVDAISPEVAQALAKHPGHLALKGVTTLSPDAARELAKHRKLVSLPGLTTLSDEATAALRKNPNVELPEKFRL